MYKKFGVLFILVFGLLIIATGCGNAQDNQTNTDNSSSKNRSNKDNPADIVGVVKSIVGNEIVIAKIDMEKIREQRQQNMTDKQKEKMKNNFATQGSGVRPGRGTGMGKVNTEQRDEMMSEMLKNSAGDVKVIVPVGIPIKKAGQEEGSLVDIKSGIMINIWLNKSVTSTKVADSVVIR